MPPAHTWRREGTTGGMLEWPAADRRGPSKAREACNANYKFLIIQTHAPWQRRRPSEACAEYLANHLHAPHSREISGCEEHPYLARHLKVAIEARESSLSERIVCLMHCRLVQPETRLVGTNDTHHHTVVRHVYPMVCQSDEGGRKGYKGREHPC